MTRDETLKAAGDAGIVAIQDRRLKTMSAERSDVGIGLLPANPSANLDDAVPEGDQGESATSPQRHRAAS